MTLNITGVVLDLLIIVILVLSIFRGYRKGIVDRALHFISTLLIVALAWFLAKPIGGLFHFSQLADLDPILVQLLSPLIGQIIGFVVVFIVLSIIRSIIFVVLRALIEKIKKHISLIRWVDNIFGAFFNVAKNTLLVYVLLLVLCTPLFTNGVEVVNASKVSTTVLKISPRLSEQVVNLGEQIIAFTHVDEWVNRDFDMQDMVEFLDVMVDWNIMDQADLDTFYMNYQSEFDSIPIAMVSAEEYDDLMALIESLPASEQLKNVAASKIMIAQ